MKIRRKGFCIPTLCVLTSILFRITSLSAHMEPSTDLTKLNIEELMSIEVTSVSKKAERLSETTSAIYVITQEDIRRSGVTSIAQALRMVPGMEVERINANKWAISSRGFNGRFANKLLVLIDGRSVYTPIYSGVYWAIQDTLLEDVERIEVIRGPGATLWGSNAVNGVVNIITKSAKDTQGQLVTLGAGSEAPVFGGVRYGTHLGRQGHWRIYTTYSDHDQSVDASGDTAADAWDIVRAGFRMDWDMSGTDRITFQGDIYDSRIGGTLNLASMSAFSPFNADYVAKAAGGNVLARWKHVFPDDSDMELQFYYDRNERDHIGLEQSRDAVDIDFQHRFRWGKCQEVIWGLGYRLISDDELYGTFTVSFDPEKTRNHLFSGFVQDQISLLEDQLRVILGLKVEHHYYTGFEYQPNIRMIWKPDGDHSLWGAVSRAVKTPARDERHIRINMGTIPGTDGSVSLLSLMGNSAQESESLLAYEIGYRFQSGDSMFLDITAFYNTYKKLGTLAPAAPFFEPYPSPPHLVIPIEFGNLGHGQTYGMEIAFNVNVTDNWTLFPGYSWMKTRLHPSMGEIELNDKNMGPEHQIKLRSYLNLPHDLEFDVMVNYVDRFSSQNSDDHVRVDTRLGWHPSKTFELSICLENLLDDQHAEFDDIQDILPTEVERSIYGKIVWRF